MSEQRILIPLVKQSSIVIITTSRSIILNPIRTFDLPVGFLLVTFYWIDLFRYNFFLLLPKSILEHFDKKIFLYKSTHIRQVLTLFELVDKKIFN